MLHILKESSYYITANSGLHIQLNGGEVCFNCHRYETYVSGEGGAAYTNFRKGAKNLHRSHADDGSCYQCHDSHGSQQLHLINLDTSINNQQSDHLVLLSGDDGNLTNSQTFWQISPDGGEKTCFIECHGVDHSSRGKRYPGSSGGGDDDDDAGNE